MQQSPRDGTKLGAYSLIRLIARGGMGEVYEAHESKLQRRVALKLIAPTNPSEHDQEELIRRFMLEARTLAKINHPNVVTIYAIDNIVDVPFIAMEYVDGVSFRELVEQFTFTADGAAPLFLQMCEGVKALHDNQIIHRDLKPHNILLRRDGQVKILDFGIAKGGEANSDHTRAGVVVGTLPYMPPEVKSGVPASPRSDIWALGAIFFECLTGDRLVTAQTDAPKGVDVPFNKDEVARIPAEMRALITKMCAARPAQRYQNVSEVIEELRAFRRDRPQVPAAMWEQLTKKVDEIAETNKKIAGAEAPRVQFTQLLAKQARDEHTPAAGEIRDITGDRQRAAAEAQTQSHPVVSTTRRRWIAPALALILVLAFVWKVRERILPERTPAPTETSAPTTAPTIAPTPTPTLTAAPTPTALAPAANGPASVLPTAPGALATHALALTLVEPADKRSIWLEAEQVPTFAWSRVLERGEYRIEVAADQDFKDVRVSEAVTGGSFRPSHPLEDGTYFWRLAPAGPGRPAIGPARVVVNVLAPAQLSTPEAQEHFGLKPREDGAGVRFTWVCPTRPTRFALEVGLASAARPLVEQMVAGCEASPRRFAPGTYRWRVRAEAAPGGPPPPWSEVRQFVVDAAAPVAPTAPAAAASATPAAPAERAAPAPRTHAPLVEPRLINAVQNVTLTAHESSLLRWQKVPGARAYLIQISTTRDFSHPLVEERTNGVQFTWRTVVPGRSYWRVGAVSGEAQGPFSERGQIDALIPPPVLMPRYTVNAPALDFKPAPRAERYVIQVARSRDLAGAESQVSTRPRATLDDAGGTFFVRAAAANASGEVISSFSNLAQVDVPRANQIKAPELLTPPPKARAPARNGRISIIFSWDRAEGAEVYVLEISNDADFRRVIERKATRERGAVYKQAALSGRVFWRVRAKAKAGQSEWSRPYYFDVID